MAKILQFIRPEHAFDPETVRMLGVAFDKAIHGLHDQGQPEIVREIVAKRIIALATRGERDPDRLCDSALAALRITR
jgi:hypothetical protein